MEWTDGRTKLHITMYTRKNRQLPSLINTELHSTRFKHFFKTQNILGTRFINHPVCRNFKSQTDKKASIRIDNNF